MATFLQIQTRVKRRVIDLPAAVVTEVPDLINEAMVTLQTEHNFKVMEATTAQLTTTIATRALSVAAVPSDFKEIRGKPYLVDNTGRHIDLIFSSHKADVEREFSVSDADDIGEPKVILDPEFTDDDGTRSWQVYPFPDGLSDFTGGEYRVIIPYWKYVAALSADGDTNWFTVNALDYLIREATSEAFALDWDEERMAVWAQRSSVKKREVINRDKLTRVAGLDVLKPRADVNASRLRS